MNEVAGKEKILMLASVASMIDQFNMPNIWMLIQMGYEVHVACNFKEGNTCDKQRIRKLRKQLQHMHVKFYQWDCPRSVYSIKQWVIAFRQLWILTNWHHYAGIHCHSPIGGVLARVVAHYRSMNVLYTAHGFHFYKGAPAKNWILFYPVEKLLSYWTDMLLTINKEDYMFAKRNLHAGKICYIPGIGIDIKKFQVCRQDMPNAEKSCKNSAWRAKYKIPQQAILLLSVGELCRRKNHRAALAALAGILKLRPDVYYLICGQGPLQKSLIRYAQMLHVSSHVRIVGFVEDIEHAYREADIFLFPSYQEGMPVALMEAMAAGMPCAVSDIRGNRELITNQELRFSPQQPAQMQTILLRLFTDEKWRKSCIAYNQKKIRAYDRAIVQKKMERLYRELAENRSAKG